MKIFLHIGYPKCFSTTLQREYYSKHPDIFYGGIGCGDSNIEFHNDGINMFFESGLIYFRNKHYKRYLISFKKTFEIFKQDANQVDKKIAGFSSEHTLFNFTPQTIDIDIKLKRLYELFGNDLMLIWIIREPLSLCISLYKEYVKMGYKYSLDHFLNWIYQYQDRSFFWDIHYNQVYENMLEYFSKDQILVLSFENYKNCEDTSLSETIVEDIGSFLEVSTFKVNFTNRNPSLNTEDLNKRILANQEVDFDFGSRILEGIEDHRRRVFFNKELQLGIDEKVLFHNVIKKRKVSKLANNLQLPANYVDNLTFEFTPAITKMLESLDKDVALLSQRLGEKINSKFSRQRQIILDSMSK